MVVWGWAGMVSSTGRAVFRLRYRLTLHCSSTAVACPSDSTSLLLRRFPQAALWQILQKPKIKIYFWVSNDMAKYPKIQLASRIYFQKCIQNMAILQYPKSTFADIKWYFPQVKHCHNLGTYPGFRHRPALSLQVLPLIHGTRSKSLSSWGNFWTAESCYGDLTWGPMDPPILDHFSV